MPTQDFGQECWGPIAIYFLPNRTGRIIVAQWFMNIQPSANSQNALFAWLLSGAFPDVTPAALVIVRWTGRLCVSPKTARHRLQRPYMGF